MKIQVALQNIVNSPFRDFKLNPLRERAIEALEESIETTGYWGNAVLRKRKDSMFETVSGHHRIEVLKNKHKNELETKYEFEVEEASDSDVQKRMAREHHSAYNHDLTDMIERVQMAVTSLSDGRIDPLDLAPDLKTKKEAIRYAPSYVPGKVLSGAESAPHPYTSTSLARFLGSTRDKGDDRLMPSDSVIAALAFLENLELKLWDKRTITTFQKSDGSIPIQNVIKAASDIEQKTKVIRARAQVNAQQTAETGKEIQARLNKIKAEQKAAEAEHQRLVESRAEALKQKAKEKAERIKTELAEKAMRDAERSERFKVEMNEWRANERKRAESDQAQRDAEKKAELAAEARWDSDSKALRDSLDRVLSEEDPVTARLKVWVRDKRVTDMQRGLLKLALQRLSNRAADFNPETTKAASAKEGR